MNAVIPAELRERRQWVVWRLEKRDGKLTKVPYVARPPQDQGASGIRKRWRASSTYRTTWRTYPEAVEVAKDEFWNGIGYVFAPDDPYCGIDLDNCLDGDNLHPAAGAILATLDSYAETSPSGRGVKTIIRASLNGFPHHVTSKTGWGGKFEVYDQTRFFTVTGAMLRGCPATIEDRQAQLDQVLAAVFPKPAAEGADVPRPVVPLDIDDQELLDRALRAKNGASFDRLYRGDTTGHGSASEADLALCGLIAFWAGPDPDRVDRLFRGSGLMRDKWDTRRGESTYGLQTVARALEGRTEFYRPPRTVTPDPVVVAVPQARAEAQAQASEWGWPVPLSEAAYHGVAGHVVRVIEPETQADPAAVLVQFLTAFGAACGREPAFTVDGARHGVNLFAQIVGDSATSRKGSSLAQAFAPIGDADPFFSYTTGMASGEGLIWEVRDPIEKRRKARSKEEKLEADADGYVVELVDAGIDDKRLLVVESEFASVLARMGREGNTLSPVIRQAWDGLTLKTMTKVTPAVATGAHVAICAHITVEELRQKLSETDALNGFANRFLWVCATRSKSLPRGGRPIHWQGSDEVHAIREALRWAGTLTMDVDFSDAAGELWDQEYERLETGREGLVAAVTNRAAAQTRRLATIYAVLGLSNKIEVAHLQAALEVWRYCEDSCRHLFGARTGNRAADIIVDALREAGDEGLSRTGVRDVFGRNATTVEIEAALSSLLFANTVRREERDTGGRPEERWWLR